MKKYLLLLIGLSLFSLEAAAQYMISLGPLAQGRSLLLSLGSSNVSNTLTVWRITPEGQWDLVFQWDAQLDYSQSSLDSYVFNSTFLVNSGAELAVDVASTVRLLNLPEGHTYEILIGDGGGYPTTRWAGNWWSDQNRGFISWQAADDYGYFSYPDPESGNTIAVPDRSFYWVNLL
jgi:hypothetical protein